MSKAIIELYVDKEDLCKQLDIIFDNGYEKITVSREKRYLDDEIDMAQLDTKYFIRATIGKEE